MVPNIQQMQEQQQQHFNAYGQMPMQMQDNMNAVQQNDYKMNMLQQQRIDAMMPQQGMVVNVSFQRITFNFICFKFFKPFNLYSK